MRNRSLMFILEGADNGGNIPEVSDEETEQAQAELQNDSEVISEITEEAYLGTDAAVDSADAAEELEAVQDVAVKALESGEGLTEQTAEVASIAIESIRNRLGFDTSVRLVPATESFGNTNSRVFQTKMVVEGITDTLKKIWLNIKTWIMRLWDKIRQFFAKLLGSSSSRVKIAKSIKDRAAALPSSAEPKEKTLKDHGLASKVSMGDKEVSTTDIEKIGKNTSKLAGFCESVLALHNKEASIIGAGFTGKPEEALRNIFKSYSDITKSISSLSQSSFDVAAPGVLDEMSGYSEKSDKKMKETEVKYFGPFYGGKVLRVAKQETKVSETFTGGDGKITKVSVEFKNVKKSDKTTKIPALTRDQIIVYCNEVIAEANSLDGIKKLQKALDEQQKNLTKTAEQVLSSLNSASSELTSDKTARMNFEVTKDIVIDNLKTMREFGNTGPAMVLVGLDFKLNYASASLRNLRKNATT